MPDLSKTQARPSAARRSTGGQEADTSRLGPSVQSRDFARDVSGKGAAKIAQGQGLMRLGDQLRSFANAERFREQTDHIQRMHDIEKLNVERSRLAQTTALSNPNKLREALESGDFKQLPGLNPEITNSQAFFDTAHQTLATTAANEQASSEGFLAGISASDAPEDFRDTWIEAQTKGMPPVAAAAYATSFESASSKAVGQRKSVMAIENAELRTAEVYTQFQQSPPQTLEQLDQYIGAARLASAGMGPQAELDAQAGLERHLLKEAIVNNEPWALELVGSKDPERNDGLSIEERYREDVEKFEAEAQNNVGAVMSKAEAHSLQVIQSRIAMGELDDAAQNLFRHAEMYQGPDGTQSDAYLTLLGQYQTALKAQVESTAVLDGIAARNFTALDLDDVRKEDADMHRNWDQYMAERGVDPATSLERQAETIEQFEPSGKAKTYFGQLLERGDERTISLLDQLGENAKLALPKSHHALWEKIQYEPNIDDAIKKWREQRANPRGFTAETAMEEVLDIRSQSEKKSWREETLYSALEQSPAAGLDSTLWGSFDWLTFGADDLDPDDDSEVSAGLLAHVDKITGQVVMDHPDATKAQIQKIVSERLSNMIAVEYNDGKPRAVFSPINLRGSVGGTGTAIVNPDSVYMEEADGHLDKKLSGLTRGHVGTVTSPRRGRVPSRQGDSFATDRGASLEYSGTLKVDSDTALNRGVVPHFKTGSGGEAPLTFDATGVQFLPPELAESDMFKGWGEPVDAADLVDPTAPKGWVARVPPADGTMVDDRLMWSTTGGYTTLRYVGPDIQTQTQQRLDRRGNPVVNSGQGSQHRSHPLLRSRARADARKKVYGNAAKNTNLDHKAQQDITLGEYKSDEESWLMISKAHADSNQRAEYLLNMSGSQRGLQYAKKYDKFLAVNEGPSTSYVYDDKVRGHKRWKAGDKKVGALTIGRGYNMERGDWSEVSRKLGLNEDQAAAVKRGERELTEPQLNRLNALLSDEAARAVYKRYKHMGGLPESFYLARMSMWHHGVQDPPNMDKALMAGDWNLVAEEILFRSKKGADKSNIRGFQARRAREARLMLGPHVESLRPDLKEILLSVDPWRNMAEHGDY